MKIQIKKKYIAGLAMAVSGVLGYLIFQGLFRLFAQRDLGILIVPIIFIISTIYVVNYWIELSHKEKLAGEAAREVARTDWKRQEEIREHLINKVFNESYTINFLYGKVKLTSGWAEQEEIDKVKNNKNIPEVVKKELIR